MTTLQITDFGEPVEHAGAMLQFMVCDGSMKCLGYFTDRSDAETFVRIKSEEDEQQSSATDGPEYCENGDREKRMVVLEKYRNGKPKVWCDPCIVDLVKALNDTGHTTVASCCGHGRPLGIISLKDGRQLLIVHDYEQAMTFVALNGLSIVTPKPCRRPSTESQPGGKS